MSRYNGPDGNVYAVSPQYGESAVLWNVVREGASEEDWEHVASYRERWRAENHAITGCGCRTGAHYYGVPEPDCARAEGREVRP